MAGVPREVLDRQQVDESKIDLTDVWMRPTAESGLRTSLHLAGPVSVLPAALAEDFEAVVREAVSNVVRYAAATSVTVSIVVGDDVTIEIIDDGVGLPADTPRRSGIADMQTRAQSAHVFFAAEAKPVRGTTLRWSAPLP